MRKALFMATAIAFGVLAVTAKADSIDRRSAAATSSFFAEAAKSAPKRAAARRTAKKGKTASDSRRATRASAGTAGSTPKTRGARKARTKVAALSRTPARPKAAKRKAAPKAAPATAPKAARATAPKAAPATPPKPKAKSDAVAELQVPVTGKAATTRAQILPVIKAVTPPSLPVKLVDAVISKESRYNIHARGSSGEIGLMQLMPNTARALARALGNTKVAKMNNAQLRKHLTNPRRNIKLGTAYLAKCYKMAKRNIAATIGCYNAGPGNMWKWREIKITRNYVKYVRGRMASAS